MTTKKTDNSPLKNVIDNASGSTVIITTPDSSVVYANKKIQEKTGFAPAEVIGKKPGQLWGGHMEKSFYATMWQTIDQQKKPFTGLVNNIKKDGVAYSELAHIAPILDTAGNVKFFIEISPENQSFSSAEERFARDFTSEFNKQGTDDESIVNFFLHLFSFSNPKIVGQSAKNSFESFLSQTLINPTISQYRNRSEDVELIHTAQLNSAHFDKLYQKYFLKVKKYFLQRADAALAEDLTQETFLQAFKYLPRFTISNASYLTYLLRIAHNVLVGHYRVATHSPATQDMTLVENEPATLIDQAKLWDMQKLWEAVHAMPAIEQKIVTLKYQQDRLIKDIATEVDKSENAVKLILSRARKKLRHSLISR